MSIEAAAANWFMLLGICMVLTGSRAYSAGRFEPKYVAVQLVVLGLALVGLTALAAY